MIVSNTAWSIYNFRRNLIRELRSKGYGVLAVAPPDEYASRVLQTGARYIPLPMDNSGTNPLRDLHLCLWLRRILKQERPLCVLSFTIKPNIYGALAARSLGIPSIANVSGLGTAFIKQNWITRIVRTLCRIGLSAATQVLFQNQDDREYFIQQGLVHPAKTRLLPGSGVDTAEYHPVGPRTRKAGGFRFILLGRIMWDKGVGEYVAAAALVRRRFPDCEFILMGFLGVPNATAIGRSKVAEWERQGLVKYRPPTDDVKLEIASADCVVLPSYREGTPKALLEGASMAKPIITTDVPGCRQVVEDGTTGFLVRARDPLDLAEKMERMILLPQNELEAMGARGREKMVREFDERIVLEEYMRAVHDLAPVRTGITI